jgi:DNA-binding transcriptional MocR family regulator
MDANQAQLALTAEKLVAQLGRWAEEKGPLYARLAGAIVAAIERGEALPGARLPPERELARVAAVGRNTVAAAYRLLHEQGLLERRQGSGTRVSAPNGAMARAGELASASGYKLASLGIGDEDEGTISLVAGAPAGLEGLAELASEVSPELANAAAGGGYWPLGYPPLREEIAKRLSQRGLATDASEVLVTTGAQQAIAITALAFVRSGDVVVIEDPTYAGAIDAYRHVGARLMPVPVAADGIDLDLLRPALNGAAAKLVYATPTFHNPTGSLMPRAARLRLSRFVREAGAILVEDETLAELSLGADAPAPVAANPVDAAIITVGSLSKLCWAGLRVGWLRAPRPLFSHMARVKAILDLGSSLPAQLLATALLRDGHRIRDARRSEIRSRYDLLASMLAHHLESWRHTPPAGGLVLWAKLPHGSATDLAAVARHTGVVILPGPMTSPSARYDDHIRLPFIAEPTLLEEGVRRLSQAWQTYNRSGASERALQVVV